MALDFGFVLLLPLVVLRDITKYDKLTILVIEINVNALQQVISILLADSAHCDIPALLLLFVAVTILNLVVELVDLTDVADAIRISRLKKQLLEGNGHHIPFSSLILMNDQVVNISAGLQLLIKDQYLRGEHLPIH